MEERAQYYMEKVNVYDAIYRVDADQVTTYVNSYGIDWAEEDIFDVGSEAMETCAVLASRYLLAIFPRWFCGAFLLEMGGQGQWCHLCL